MAEPSSPLTDWIEEPPAETGKPRKQRPEDYLWLRWWFHPVVMGLTLVLLAGVVGVARMSSFAGAFAALLVALAGLTATMIAHAWGVAIVFADSPKRGLWFAMFPPYMVYYAVIRWNWMAQPTVLFLCGLALAFGAIYAARAVEPELGLMSQLHAKARIAVAVEDWQPAASHQGIVTGTPLLPVDRTAICALTGEGIHVGERDCPPTVPETSRDAQNSGCIGWRECLP